MDRLGPQASLRVLVLLGVDQLITRHAKLAQGFAAQVHQQQVLSAEQQRMQLPVQLELVIGLEPGGKGHVVEHRFHCRTVEAGATVQGRDRLAAGVPDRAETGIALEPGVELAGAVEIQVHPVDRRVPGPDQGRQLQHTGRRRCINHERRPAVRLRRRPAPAPAHCQAARVDACHRGSC
ncbi:hypothetical protein D3C77_377260 [compost metagenome]